MVHTCFLFKILNVCTFHAVGIWSTQAVGTSQVMPWHLGEDLFRNCWDLLGDKATVMVEGNGYLWKNTDNYGKWWATETPQEITCNQKEWIWLDAWIASAAMSFSVSIVVQQDWCDVCSSWRIKCLNVPWGLQHSAELQRHSGQPRRFVPNKEGVGHNGKASRAKCTKCACHDKVIETRGLWRKTWY